MSVNKKPTLNHLYSYIDYFENLQPGEGYTVIEDKDNQKGVISLPIYKYDPIVSKFEQEVYESGLMDHDYHASLEKAGFFGIKDQDDWISKATQPGIWALITFCLRGERFCDGFLAKQLQNKTFAKLLRRLKEIDEETLIEKE